MTVTIIPQGGFVSVDGKAYTGLNLSFLAASIHAIQWNGQTGHIEHKNPAGRVVANEAIDDFTPYQPAVTLWEAARDADPGFQPDPDTETFEQRQVASLMKVDADVDSITQLVIGNRGNEYVEAEAQALAFQTAGYTGPVPSMVQAWVDAKAIEGSVWTPQQSAEDILATAMAWRSAVDLIRANRLSAKAYVRIAQDDEDLAVAMGTWAGFVQAVRAQLGI